MYAGNYSVPTYNLLSAVVEINLAHEVFDVVHILHLHLP